VTLPAHLTAWLAAIAAKRSLPIELSDGTGRDAALPTKIAQRLRERGLIAVTADGRAWTLTIEGRRLAAGKS
jgi:hypothetical protein